jgi:putative tryptophan/tyrosine transport system substrate-binding protein
LRDLPSFQHSNNVLHFPKGYRPIASYVDSILCSTKPEELSVQAPNKIELVINQRTATALGLEVPAELIALADEVIK